MKVPVEIPALLHQGKNFILATHIDPDADTLGSALALGSALEIMAKEVVLYNSKSIPKLYDFMPGAEKFTSSVPDSGNRDTTLIVLDCNDPVRAELNNMKFSLSAVIDHHETIKDFGNIKWIEPKAAATGLMVYQVLKELGTKITKDIATNLYTAIAVDTGTFRYSNTDSSVLMAGAELVDAGAEPSVVAENLYQSWSDERFRLLVMTLDTIEIAGDIAITHVTEDMFAKTGATPADTDNFSNFPRMMRSAKVSAFFRETAPGSWKASLRSKGHVNVARVAEMFSGGGHQNAAGYNIKSDIKTAKQELLRAVQKVRDSGSVVQG